MDDAADTVAACGTSVSVFPVKKGKYMLVQWLRAQFLPCAVQWVYRSAFLRSKGKCTGWHCSGGKNRLCVCAVTHAEIHASAVVVYWENLELGTPGNDKAVLEVQQTLSHPLCICRTVIHSHWADCPGCTDITSWTIVSRDMPFTKKKKTGTEAQSPPFSYMGEILWCCCVIFVVQIFQVYNFLSIPPLHW